MTDIYHLRPDGLYRNEERISTDMEGNYSPLEDGPQNYAYWWSTPWADLHKAAKTILSRKAYKEWRARPEVIERSQMEP